MVDVEVDTEGVLTPQLARAIGRKTGLVSTLWYTLPVREDPNPLECLSLGASPVDPSELRDRGHSGGSLSVGGKGETLREVVATGVGETIERFAMTFPSIDARTTASYDELAADYDLPDPAYFQYFSESERERLGDHYYHLDDFDPSEEREWLFGTNLISGERACLPAGIVPHTRTEDRRPIRPGTTSGVCCHETYERALLGSIYEYVERDAFMRTWYTRTPPTRLDVDGLDSGNATYEYHLYEYDVGVDLPTVGCLGQKRDGSRSFVCGGAGSSIETAVRDTLCEATQCFNSVVSESPAGDADSQEIDPATITTMDGNVTYYDDMDGLGELAFLLEGPERERELSEPRAFERPEAELDHVVDVLEREAVTPVALDITPPAISDMGLVVTRVVVPELVPLTLPSFPVDAHPELAGRIETDAPHPYP